MKTRGDAQGWRVMGFTGAQRNTGQAAAFPLAVKGSSVVWNSTMLGMHSFFLF